jgi:hypothetical protein
MHRKSVRNQFNLLVCTTIVAAHWGVTANVRSSETLILLGTTGTEGNIFCEATSEQ